MNKHFFFYILAVWFVLTQTLPPFNILFPFQASLKFLIFDVVTILLFPSLLSKRSIVALLVYSMVTLVYHFLGNAFFDTISTVVIPLLIMLSGLLIAEYALKYDKKYKFTRTIVIVVAITNVFMSLISIPQVINNPNIIRPSVLEENTEYFDRYWLITYLTCHGLPLIFAPLIFLFRNSFRDKKWFFICWIMVFLILFIIVFSSNATTPFLIAIVMVMCGFFFRSERLSTKNIRALILIGLLSLLMVQPVVVVPVLSSLQKTMDTSSNNYQRLEELKDDVIYGEAGGDWGVRQDLYATSTRLFFESPITGTYYPEKISHHSWFLDRLACFGLLFIAPLVFLFIIHIKTMYRCLIHTKVVYMIGILGFLLMLFLKNDFGIGSWLYGFAFLPLICRYGDYVVDNKLNK